MKIFQVVIPLITFSFFAGTALGQENLVFDKLQEMS